MGLSSNDESNLRGIRLILLYMAAIATLTAIVTILQLVVK